MIADVFLQVVELLLKLVDFSNGRDISCGGSVRYFSKRRSIRPEAKRRNGAFTLIPFPLLIHYKQILLTLTNIMSFDIKLFFIQKQPFFALHNYLYFKAHPYANPKHRMALKVITYTTHQQFNLIENQIKLQMLSHHPNIAQIRGYNTIQTQDTIGINQKKVLILMDDLGQNLENINRNDQVFVKRLICDLVKALKHLEQLQVSHGNVRCSSIFYNNDKFVLNEFLYSQNNIGTKSVIKKTVTQMSRFYFDPQMIQQLNKGSQQFHTNLYKLDVYYLGILILQILSEKSMTNNCKLNQLYLNKQIKIVGNKYGDIISKILRNMLAGSQKNRMSFGQLYKELETMQQVQQKLQIQSQEYISKYIKLGDVKIDNDLILSSNQFIKLKSNQLIDSINQRGTTIKFTKYVAHEQQKVEEIQQIDDLYQISKVESLDISRISYQQLIDKLLTLKIKITNKDNVRIKQGIIVGQNNQSIVNQCQTRQKNGLVVKKIKNLPNYLILNILTHYKDIQSKQIQGIGKIQNCLVQKQNAISSDLYIISKKMKSNLAYNNFNRKMNFKDKVSICAKLLSSISKMHWFKLMHGNIKPSNILLDFKNNPYLVDFLSPYRLLNVNEKQSNRLNYYNPPQYYRKNGLSEKSDIWSIGITLFQFIFRVDINKRLIQKYKLYHPMGSIQIDKSLINSPIEKKIYQIIIAMVRYDPQQRPQAIIIQNFFQKLSQDINIGIIPRNPSNRQLSSNKKGKQQGLLIVGYAKKKNSSFEYKDKKTVTNMQIRRGSAYKKKQKK